jgi:hypothetical protein
VLKFTSDISQVVIPELVEIPLPVLMLSVHRPWIPSPRVLHPDLHSVDFIDAPVKFQVCFFFHFCILFRILIVVPPL